MNGGRFKKIALVLLAVILVTLAFCFSGCGASPSTPAHLIKEEDREITPVRPVDEKAEKQVEGDSFVDRQKSLLETVKNGFKPTFSASTDDVKAVYDKAVEILSRYIRNDFTEYERVHAIHDYLCTTVEYDVTLYNEYLSGKNVSKGHDSFNISGALMLNKAVCDGLAKAFSLLTAIEGIQAECIYGEYESGGFTMSHVWNKVKIGGVWYNVDVTLDRARVNIGGKERTFLHHGYFLISDRENESRPFGMHKADGDIKVNPVNEQTGEYGYAVYENMSIDIGGKEYDALITSGEQLHELLKAVKKAKRKVGTLDIKLKIDGVTANRDGAFDYYLKDALGEVKNTDFPFDREEGIRPYVQYPDGAILLFIYR